MELQPAATEIPARAPAPKPFDHALARLDAWLETIRGAGGYGGPVAHWWRQSLSYTGPGRDWRYEGIVAGYLLLWRRSGDERWLSKAQRAGDDLLAGQVGYHYAASGFEENPCSAGTPHEAAADVALLLLALALRQARRAGAEHYAAGAVRNLHGFYIDQLWDANAKSFRDSPAVASFVPNKAATACEALFLLAELTGDSSWVDRYALPNLRRILEHQVRAPGRLYGAIAQNSFGPRVVEKYFPIYIARCVPALLRGFGWTNDERLLDGALGAMRFVVSWMDADGTLPTAIYANAKASRGPAWLAPLGDVLRAADLLRPHGFAADLRAAQQHLLAAQDASGGIQTARGFAAQALGRPAKLPDARDLLHVAGWCDKAFRYMAAHAGPALPAARSEPFDAECSFGGRSFVMAETPAELTFARRGAVCYRWRKGAAWAEINDPVFWLA